MSYFKGVVFVAALGVTALAGSFTILVPGLLLLPISMKAYRRYNDFVLELWLSFVTVSLARVTISYTLACYLTHRVLLVSAL